MQQRPVKQTQRKQGTDYVPAENDLIGSIDWLGLTKWHGECEIYGVGLTLGILFIDCSLESFCTIGPDNHREWVLVKAALFQAEVGIPVSYTRFHASFTSPGDSDHRAFSGWGEVYGGGWATGPIGAHIESMTIGSATSDHLGAHQVGFDLGMFMAKGRSWVKKWSKHCCDGD